MSYSHVKTIVGKVRFNIEFVLNLISKIVIKPSILLVKKVEPELSMENKYQLNHVVHFSKESEVANVTSLLCQLRTLFLKNYF